MCHYQVFTTKPAGQKNNEQLTMRTEATSEPQEHIAPTSLSPAFIKRMLAWGRTIGLYSQTSNNMLQHL